MKFTMVEDEEVQDEEVPDEAETGSAESKAEETESEVVSETEEEDEGSDKSDTETAESETSGTGIDATLSYLDENNPDLAKSVRDLQTNFVRINQDTAGFERNKAELQSILDEVRAVREQEEETATQEAFTPEEEPEDPLEDVPAHQRELFEKGFDYYARQQGLVRQSDLDASTAREATEAMAADQAFFIKDENQKAITSFGDRLVKPGNNGTLNEDSLADGVKEKLLETRDRISDTRKGLTWGDIFRTANYEDDVNGAEEKGYQRGLKESSTSTQKRVEGARRSRTVSGSKGGGASKKPVIYERSKDKDDPDKVYDRAFRYAESVLAE